MKTVIIPFKPSDLKQTDEAYLPFIAGNLVLFNFWALYKRTHLTNQLFRDDLKKLHAWLLENEYYTIDEFRNASYPRGSEGGLRLSMLAHPSYDDFVIKHWDYFNPNLRKRLRVRIK